MTRRELLQTAASATLLGGWTHLLDAATDFWNRKPASNWSAQEVEELLTRSPWSKDVNAEFISDADYTTGGKSGPVIGRGGSINAPGTGSASQVQLGGNTKDSAGPKTRVPVTVRWESAAPIRDAAAGIPLSATLKDRYVISVSGLPLGVMDKPARGLRTDPATADNSPEARQRRMIEALSGSATLQARGQAPEQAGVVEAAPKTPGTYLFGFSKELLPIDANSREIIFTLETAMMAVKAKFDTKTMLYRGHLAV